jgi:Rap1a immunity proteins
MEGFLTFNAKLVADRKPKQFCLPPKQEITAQQAAEIMMRQAKTVPDADNYPISILLLAGLIDTFPCGDQTRRILARPRGEKPAEQSQAKQDTHRKHRVGPSKDRF